MPEMRGLDLLRALRETRSKPMVLPITALGSIDLAVEAVRGGAVDFLVKPFRIEVLVLAMQQALRERQMCWEIVRLREAAVRETPPGIAARSPAMRETVDLARRAARSGLPVSISAPDARPSA